MKNFAPSLVQHRDARLSPRRRVPAYQWHCALLLIAVALLAGCKPPPEVISRQKAIEEIEKLGCTTSSSDDHLSISATAEFDDDHLAKLQDFATAKLFKTVKLQLTGSQVTAAGLEHLQKLANVQTLLLADLPATDDTLKHLAPMKGGLTDLELHGTKITDAGLKHLEVLTSLQALTVPNTISDAAIANLKKKLRELDVERVPELKEVEKLPEQDEAEKAPEQDAAEKTPEQGVAEKTPEKQPAEETPEVKQDGT